MTTLNLRNMEKDKKGKVVFWLKMVAAIVAAVLATLGVASATTSCSTHSGFTLSADTLYMDNPSIEVVDSTRISLP